MTAVHWIVEDNLINPQTLERLLAELDRQHVSYTRVQIAPIFHVLMNEVIVPEAPKFVYGSQGMKSVCQEQSWLPGYYDEQLDYELMLQHYGHRCLNAQAHCSTLAEVKYREGRFFIRPVLDNKSFAGTTMDWPAFEVFRAGVARVNDEAEATLKLDERVMVSTYQSILHEYRFFVIGQRVVTGSIYGVPAHSKVRRDIPPEVWSFAQDCVDRWSPNPAFTIDIATTLTRGPKVIELNSANSSGFYDCDLSMIVQAVQSRLT